MQAFSSAGSIRSSISMRSGRNCRRKLKWYLALVWCKHPLRGLTSESIGEFRCNESWRDQTISGTIQLFRDVRHVFKHKPFEGYACVDNQRPHIKPSLISSSVREG